MGEEERERGGRWIDRVGPLQAHVACVPYAVLALELGRPTVCAPCMASPSRPSSSTPLKARPKVLLVSRLLLPHVFAFETADYTSQLLK